MLSSRRPRAICARTSCSGRTGEGYWEQSWRYEYSQDVLGKERRVKRSNTLIRAASRHSERGLLLDVNIFHWGRLISQKVEKAEYFLLRGYLIQADFAPRDFTMEKYHQLGVQAREQLLKITTFRYAGREMLNGREAMVYEFITDGSRRDTPLLDRELRKTRGRIWFDRAERIAVKAYGEFRKTMVISRGSGYVVKKGELLGMGDGASGRRHLGANLRSPGLQKDFSPLGLQPDTTSIFRFWIAARLG